MDDEVIKFVCTDCGVYFYVKDRNNFKCPNCEDTKTLYESLTPWEKSNFDEIDSLLSVSREQSLKVLKALIEKYERGFKQ